VSELRKERQRARIVAQTKQEAAKEAGCSCTSLIGPSDHCQAHGMRRLLTATELKIFERLATTIRDNRHLWKTLSTVPEDRREIIYKQIRPFVTFKCLPWPRLLATFSLPNDPVGQAEGAKETPATVIQ
jgi:hypothetical protein